MESGRPLAAERGQRDVRTAVSEIDLKRARTEDDALKLMRDELRTPIAGATDLYVALNFGTLQARKFVDIWAIDDLRGFTMRGQTLIIGALATYADAINSPLVAQRLPMLAQAARLVGGPPASPVTLISPLIDWNIGS